MRQRRRRGREDGGHETEGRDQPEGFALPPYRVRPGHASQHDDPESQEAREEPSTDPKGGDGWCFHASHLPREFKT